MIAAICARKSTDQTGVADEQSPSRARWNTRGNTPTERAGPSTRPPSSPTTASAARSSRCVMAPRPQQTKKPDEWRFDRGLSRLQLLTKLAWGFVSDSGNKLDPSEFIVLLEGLDDIVADLLAGQSAMVARIDELYRAADPDLAAREDAMIAAGRRPKRPRQVRRRSAAILHVLPTSTASASEGA
jgi:hypothetical protein